MRLLHVKKLQFAEFPNPDTRPRYVIISHRWARDEVTFRHLRDGCNKQSEGYAKVKGFVRCARKHLPHIKWLWIDTCCINKDSEAELSSAINSMFRWYRNAELCIARLAGITDPDDHKQFEQDEWFCRGWTLQELLAPRTVLFVDSEWRTIGHKGSFYGNDEALHGPDLAARIEGITGIPKSVLNDWGASVNLLLEDKLKWMNGRSTTIEEDMEYALFGIVGVTMNVIYGEGRDSAKTRLRLAIRNRDKLTAQHEEQQRKILNWLDPPDPWANHALARQRHEPHTGQGTLKSSMYQSWRSGASNHLWLYGKPGCGKTVLCSTLVEDMRVFSEASEDAKLAIFYFTFSDQRKQSYDDLLRSLAAQLGVVTEQGLILLQQAYDRPNKPALRRAELENIVATSAKACKTVYLMLDALDESPEDLDSRYDMLAGVERLTNHIPCLKILATSRELLDIRETMEAIQAQKMPIEAAAVNADIARYISRQLSKDRRLSRLNESTKALIQQNISENADGM